MKERAIITKSRERVLSLILPFVVGFGGLFITQEIIKTEVMKYIVGVLSFTLPPFFTFLFLSKYRSSTTEKIFLVFGVILIILAGFWVMTGVTLSPYWYDSLPYEVRRFSEFVGVGSILLGVLMFTIILIRRSENIEELADRFRTLTEHISEGFILSSPDGIIVDVNEQFCRFLSVSKQEIIGSSVMEMAKKYSAQEIGRKWLTRGYGISGEYEIEVEINQQKRYFWIHGTPIFDTKGRHKAVLATMKDITELRTLSEKVKKHAEELEKMVEEQTRKLKESEEYLRQLILTMNEGFLLLNKEHKIILANECFCSMLDSDREQVIGKSVYEFVDKVNLAKLLSILDVSSLERKKEINFIHGANISIPAMVSVAVIYGENENDYKLSLVVSDLRQQKKMQLESEERTKQLQKLNEELKQYGKNKDAFLSNISHELRTPISTIQGYVEMLLSHSLGPLTGHQENALQTMQRNIQRLLRMVNEMIEFSKMEIKGIQIRKKLFSTCELIEENVAFIKPKLISKQIQLKSTYKHQEIYAWADRDKISQVIGILLNNAVKFTPTGGSIEISTSVKEGNTLEISVSDTGIGIPPEYHEKIFEKFFQVDSSPTRKYEGTGIGLAIAKGIIDSHKGKINLSSTPGEGSTFTVVLPNCVFYTGEKREDVQIVKKIHVVDNEITLYHALVQYCEGIGEKVERLKNIYDLLRIMNDTTSDVVIINMYEQDIDSVISMLQMIESNSIANDSDIIVIVDESVRVDNDYINNISDRVYFIVRPFTLQQLVETINDIQKGEIKNKIISNMGGEQAKEKLILIYEPENTMKEFIYWAINNYGGNCVFLDKYEDIFVWTKKYEPYALIVDLDELKSNDISGLNELDKNEKVIIVYFISGELILKRFPIETLRGKILSKPFLMEELLTSLQIQDGKEVKLLK